MGAFVQGGNREKFLKRLDAKCGESQEKRFSKHDVCLNLCLNAQSLQA